MIKMRTGFLLLPLAGILFLVDAGAASASDHHREHLMPPAGQGVRISVAPNETVHIVASFDALNENCVQVYDYFNGGRPVAVWTNYEEGPRTWSFKNTDSRTVTFLLVGRHKNTPPNGREPWHVSPYRVVEERPNFVRIGYEDGTDNDFNDAEVAVTWVR
jgi:hypothetical protein